MVKAVPIQASFARGELSPRLHSRVDLDFYKTGLEECLNFVVFPHGGLVTRPGTQYVATAADSTKKGRLLPFEFSDTDSVMILSGDMSFRFMRAGGTIVTADTDAVITNGTFDSDMSGWTASNVTHSTDVAAFTSNGTLTQAITVADAEEEVVIRFDVDGAAHSDFLSLRVGTSSGGEQIVEDQDFKVGHHCYAFTPGSGNTTFYIQFRYGSGSPTLDNVAFIDDGPVEIGSPYTEDELASIQFSQSADILYLAHTDHVPMKLSRFGYSSWSLEKIAFTATPSEWVENNYPRVVGFYEDRLGWGSTVAEPQTLWFSKTGDFENLTTGANDDDALEFTISAGQVNAIRWVVEDQQLQIGTSGATRTLAGAGVDEALTPNSVKGKRHTSFGCADLQPIQTGGVTLFAGKNRRRLREFVYSFDVDRFVSPDLSLLSEHITRTGIKEMTYQQDPDSIIWMCREDGQLIGMTYERDQDVIAWHRHKLGGEFADTPWGVVESAATISTATRDEVWLLVKRTVNGATLRSVEILTAPFDPDDSVSSAEDAFQVDCGLSLNDPKTITAATKADPVVITSVAHGFTNGDVVRISGVVGMTELNGNDYTVANKTDDTFELTNSAGTDIDGTTFGTYISGGEAREKAGTISGLSHLEGQTVAILGDGAVYPSQVVSSGSITLPGGATVAKAHVGLPYVCRGKSLRPDVGAQNGTAQGRRKRLHKVVVNIRRTLGMQIGKAFDDLDTIPFRKGGDRMDQAPPLFDGFKEVAFNGGWDTAGQVVFQQDQPLPAQISALVPHVTTSEE